jgi:hypothetical protein
VTPTATLSGPIDWVIDARDISASAEARLDARGYPEQAALKDFRLRAACHPSRMASLVDEHVGGVRLLIQPLDLSLRTETGASVQLVATR